MADRRRLQGEIDRCLKKVTEGVETFDDIWQKVHNATNSNQKEKYESDLKKEIKKLQRLRDQIKTWLASSDIKDKRQLIENRKLIESQMERFKVVERETKTKAYSKEGLGAAQKLDPAQQEKDEINQWLSNSINSLNLQSEQYESEIESLLASFKKKRDKEKEAQIDKIKTSLHMHRFHIVRLETILRKLDNMTLDVEQIKMIKDDVEYYIESHEEFGDDSKLIYDDLDLDSVEAIALPKVSVDEDVQQPNANSTPVLTSSAPVPLSTTPTTTTTSTTTVSSPATIAPISTSLISTTTSTASVQSATLPALCSNITSTTLVPTSSPIASTVTSTTVSSPSIPTSTIPIFNQSISITSQPTQAVPPISAHPTSTSAHQTLMNAPAPVTTTAASAPSTAYAFMNTTQANAGKTPLTPTISPADSVNTNQPTSTQLTSQPTAQVLSTLIPPLLGVAPLGPVSLSKTCFYQLAMLDAAANHTIYPTDSQRLRLHLPPNRCQSPAYYPQQALPLSDTTEFFSRLTTETLFFIFYFMEGTKAQFHAARALKKQSWRFHTKYLMWFQRHEEPKTITDEFEQGTYIYFDYDKWGQRKKEGFTFEYRYLEDKDLNNM